MKNIKISIHFMPWEIDEALLMINKIKQSSYFLQKEHKLYLDTALNLSSAIIDWETSSLPKEYFIEKYNILDSLIKSNVIHKPFIYDMDEVYGALDLYKDAIDENIDCYINICPDVDFSEHLLYYMFEAAINIQDKYFIVTPEIFKSWDSSWDILVNKKFKDVPYSKCIDVDMADIRNQCLDLDPTFMEKINNFKYAGWFDLYSKGFYEELVPVLPEWKGYAPWDLYSMNVCNIAKNNGVNVNQYILRNQVTWFSDTGCLKNDEEYGGDGKLKLLYKKFLTVKMGRQEQRSDIDNNLAFYVNKWVEYAKQNGIL